MNIDTLIINPKTLALSTTFQCTAACKNCCFGCNSKLTARLSFKEMKDYVDQAVNNFPDSIKVLVLTGGECFLLKKDLLRIVEYGSSKNLVTRVVTNGYWATSYQYAYDKLIALRDAGLQEINFSTGDDHQEWVSSENIVYGCMASMDLGLTCLVNVEAHDDSSYSADKLRNDSRLKPYFNISKYDKPLIIENGVWIPFDKESNISYAQISTDKEYFSDRCTSLFNTIPINPYSEMLSCCGLTSEYILPLRLGNLKNNKMKDLYEKQFHDLIKIWIFVDGPYSVLKYIYKKRGIDKKIPKAHICYLCADIFKDNENISVIKENYDEIMPKVMFKYLLLKPTLQ